MCRKRVRGCIRVAAATEAARIELQIAAKRRDQARTRRGYAELKAPFEGRVVDRSAITEGLGLQFSLGGATIDATISTVVGMILIALEWAVGLERLSPLAVVAIGGQLGVRRVSDPVRDGGMWAEHARRSPREQTE